MELTVINEKIAQLRANESSSKALIAELIIAVTQQVHEHDNVNSANAFLLALTPVTQKKALSFLKNHVGHKVEEGIFTKRLKDYVRDGVKVSPYTEASDAFDKFVASGMNFWQWAVAKKEKEDKPITAEQALKLARRANEAMQDALKAGVLDKVQAFEALNGGLMSQDDVLNILASMSKAEYAMTKAAKAAATAE